MMEHEKPVSVSLDHVARWVPEEQKADYWRMLAHFKTLSPDDEVLRLADAMGVLTALTRQVPSELAIERGKFREEHLKIASEIKKLLEESTAKAVTVVQALEQINATAQVTLKSIEKATDSFRNAADRVDVKSIGDRLTKEIHEQSIKPISALNEKLESSGKKLTYLSEKMESTIEAFKQARWWVPWVAAFSVCGAVFTYVWHNYQSSVEQVRYEDSHLGRRRAR